MIGPFTKEKTDMKRWFYVEIGTINGYNSYLIKSASTEKEAALKARQMHLAKCRTISKSSLFKVQDTHSNRCVTVDI